MRDIFPAWYLLSLYFLRGCLIFYQKDVPQSIPQVLYGWTFKLFPVFYYHKNDTAVNILMHKSLGTHTLISEVLKWHSWFEGYTFTILQLAIITRTPVHFLQSNTLVIFCLCGQWLEINIRKPLPSTSHNCCIISLQLPPMPKDYSPELAELIRTMLSKRPEERPSVRSILRQPYIKRQISLFLEATKA